MPVQRRWPPSRVDKACPGLCVPSARAPGRPRGHPGSWWWWCWRWLKSTSQDPGDGRLSHFSALEWAAGDPAGSQRGLSQGRAVLAARGSSGACPFLLPIVSRERVAPGAEPEVRETLVRVLTPTPYQLGNFALLTASLSLSLPIGNWQGWGAGRGASASQNCNHSGTRHT